MPDMKVLPLMVLPPSFGTTLMRTPPVPTDASALEVSIWTSCIASMFGPVLPMPPGRAADRHAVDGDALSRNRLPCTVSVRGRIAAGTAVVLRVVAAGRRRSCALTPGVEDAEVDVVLAGRNRLDDRSSSTVWRSTPWTSTTGEAPVTVIVSSRAPTRISALMVAMKSPASVHAFAPERAESREGEGDASMLPGGRFTMR